MSYNQNDLVKYVVIIWLIIAAFAMLCGCHVSSSVTTRHHFRTYDKPIMPEPPKHVIYHEYHVRPPVTIRDPKGHVIYHHPRRFN